MLDASALIAPHRASENSLQDISNNYKRLVSEKRLYVAARALREYVKNRTDGIKDAHKKLSGINIPSLEGFKLPHVENVEAYKELLEVRHKCNQAVEEYRSKVNQLIDSLKAWNHNDDVSRLYAEIFSNGTILDHDTQRDELLADLEWRTLHSIPPAFKDSHKNDGGIGDLHIWHTILKAAKDLQRDVVFVSNDEKNDWMVRSEREALFARAELVYECRHKSGRNFLAMNLRRFLSVVGASPGTVAEIKPGHSSEHVETYKYMLVSPIGTLRQLFEQFVASKSQDCMDYEGVGIQCDFFKSAARQVIEFLTPVVAERVTRIELLLTRIEGLLRESVEWRFPGPHGERPGLQGLRPLLLQLIPDFLQLTEGFEAFILQS